MTESLWPQLLSSALVGTQRRPCRPEAVTGQLAEVLGDLPGELDPGGLLTAAAVLTVARRAGAQSGQGTLPEPAPAETVPGVPEAAAARLGLLLAEPAGGDHRQRRALLREWLQLAQEKGLRVPARHLTALIDLAGADTTMRPAVLAVGGQRLPWLAAQGPGRWAWIASPEPAEADVAQWETGRIASRVRYLESVRANDPERGRALLAQVWPQEKAADLAALIGACATGLQAADEPWLEKALDDKRVQIREAAAQLLAVIDGSAYRERMAQRALACVTTDGGDVLAVTPPAEFDASMRRDALAQKAPQGWGERAWWLVQILGATPLSSWSTVEADPARLLSRPVSDDWAGVLREGWLRAAASQRDVAWALALCRLPAVRGAQLTELAAVLPAGVLAELAADAVRHHADRMEELLHAAPAPWPRELAEVVVTWLQGAARFDQPSWWHLLNVIERGLPPAAVTAVNRLQANCEEGPHRDMLNRLAITLQTRHDMHQEFA